MEQETNKLPTIKALSIGGVIVRFTHVVFIIIYCLAMIISAFTLLCLIYWMLTNRNIFSDIWKLTDKVDAFLNAL